MVVGIIRRAQQCALAAVAVAAPASVSADDNIAFQIEGQLSYLVRQGYSVQVRHSPVLTEVFVGLPMTPGNSFSDLMFDAAVRTSILANGQAVLTVHEQKMMSLGRKLCFVRARKGQVFDGTC